MVSQINSLQQAERVRLLVLEIEWDIWPRGPAVTCRVLVYPGALARSYVDLSQFRVPECPGESALVVVAVSRLQDLFPGAAQATATTYLCPHSAPSHARFPSRSDERR